MCVNANKLSEEAKADLDLHAINVAVIHTAPPCETDSAIKQFVVIRNITNSSSRTVADVFLEGWAT